jgi:hypothetical protein
MHLEVMRAALYRETNAFLLAEDQALPPPMPVGRIGDDVAAVPR